MTLDNQGTVLCGTTRILSLTLAMEQPGDCLLRTVCQANHHSSLHGNMARDAVEVGTYILVSRLPFGNTEDMIMAGRVGRVNYGNIHYREGRAPPLTCHACARSGTVSPGLPSLLSPSLTPTSSNWRIWNDVE